MQNVFCFSMLGFPIQSNMRHSDTWSVSQLNHLPGLTRPHSRTGIPSLPGSSTEPWQPLFQRWQRWPRVSDEDSKGALLAQANKMFTTGMSTGEMCRWFYLLPRGFYRDLWSDLVLPFPQKLWLIWKEASYPLLILRVRVHASGCVWISTNKNITKTHSYLTVNFLR